MVESEFAKWFEINTDAKDAHTELSYSALGTENIVETLLIALETVIFRISQLYY